LDSLGFTFDGTSYSGSGSSYTLNNINLTDTPKEAVTGNSYVQDADYEVDFFDKTAGDDGYPDDPTRSQLGF